MMLLPIPVPPDAPPWIGLLLLACGVAVFVVVLWQTVRYFRSNGDDHNDVES
jgi:hypothetical protein